ncbi:MAG: hypothetical protein QHH00_06920 [Methanomassiliicoccales archaeon]|jgi:hypothetical protein|nr:hypothetical protein [Methanomassiliicoccales archaeon]
MSDPAKTRTLPKTDTKAAAPYFAPGITPIEKSSVIHKIEIAIMIMQIIDERNNVADQMAVWGRLLRFETASAIVRTITASEIATRRYMIK